jgi:hypothetical protein
METREAEIESRLIPLSQNRAGPENGKPLYARLSRGLLRSLRGLHFISFASHCRNGECPRE